MGARQPRRSVTLPFSLLDYREIPIRRNRNQHTEHNYRLLQNINTDFQMEQYRLYFHSQTEYQQNYDAFEWRLTQQFIVSTIYFIDDVKRQFCSTSWAATIYIEHIPLKLSQIKDIPFPDNLYILSAALDGFSVIYSKIGYFTVQQYMICINKQGKVKVWVHEDLSILHPDDSNLMRQGRQGDMVNRIIQLLDFNSDPQSQPMSIRDYVGKHGNNVNFAEAKNLVRQMAKEFKVQLPMSFQCIDQILSQENDSISMVSIKKEKLSSERVSVTSPTKRVFGGQMVQKFHEHSTIKQSHVDQEFFPTLNFNHPIQVRNWRAIPQHFQSPIKPQIIVRNPQIGSPRLMNNNMVQHVESLPTLRKNRLTPIVFVRSGNPPQKQIIKSPQNTLERSAQPRIINIRYPPDLKNVPPQPKINIYRSAQQPKNSNVQFQRQKRDTYYSTKRTKKYKEDNISDVGPGYISDTSNNNKPYRQRHSQSELDNPRFNPINVEKIEKADDKNFKKKVKIKNKEEVSDVQELKPTNRVLDFSQKTSMMPGQESHLESSKRMQSGIKSPTQLSSSKFKSKIKKPTTELTEDVDISIRRDRTAFQLAQIRQKMTQTLAATRQAIKNTENMGSPRGGGPQRENMESQAKKYYSSKYGHELDPQIAMDLLGMGL